MDILGRLRRIEELLKDISEEVEAIKSEMSGEKVSTENYESTMGAKSLLSDIASSFKTP